MGRVVDQRPAWPRGFGTGRRVMLTAALLLAVVCAAVAVPRAVSAASVAAQTCGPNGCSGGGTTACASRLTRRLRAKRRNAVDLQVVARPAQFGSAVAHTPDSRTAVVVAPFGYQPYFGVSGFIPAVQALDREGYSVKILENTALSDVPSITIGRFIAAVRRAGVIVFFGHAASGLLPLETYRTEGELVRRIRELEHLTDWFKKGYVGYGTAPNESNLRQDKKFPKISYFLGLKTKGIADLVTLERHPFVWVTACHGATLRGGFQIAGAREVYGYHPEIGILGAGAGDIQKFWSELDGPEDVEPGAGLTTTRLTDNAYADCQANDGCKHTELWPGGTPMALAPAVASIVPNPRETQGVTLDKAFEIQVGFDTHMDKSMPASEVLTVKGCRVKPAPGSVLTWSGDHTIGGRFLATASGQLTITVHADAAVSADGKIELDGNNSGKTGLRGGMPRADDFVWQEACAQLNVRGLDSSLVCSKIAAGCVHGPPAASICGAPPSWSQFEVSGSGMVPGQTYDLTLGGTAHGVTENKPIGPLATDKTGNAAPRVFTLPFIPAHDPWTLTATPRGSGGAVTTTLETGVVDCVVMLASGGAFRSAIASVGLSPNSSFREIVDGTAEPLVQADAEGTVPPTEVDGTCAPGPVSVQLSGSWIDHGIFTDDATAAVRQFC